MRTCQISLSSNNKESIKLFFLFCFYNKNLDLFLIKYYLQKKHENKILTILKSPHIDKKAQEQFEKKIFVKNLSLYSRKLPKYLLFLKKIRNFIFSDVHLKVKFNVKNKNDKNLFCDLDQLKLNIFQNVLPLKKNSEKINNLIKTMDIYGEFVNNNSMLKFG